MEVKIKQFKNLQGVSFVAPCEIHGQNGKGKSNCISAISWVLSEKNTESEEVIPFGQNEAAVSIAIDGILFTRTTEYKITRKAGELEGKITGTVSNYFINGESLNKSTYFNNIKEWLGAVQYIEPLYFFTQKTAEKLEIINKIVGIEKPQANLSELQRAVKQAKTDTDNQLFLIENLNGKISDTSELQNAINAKNIKISELKNKIVSKDPIIEAYNDKILSQISEIQRTEFAPEKKKELQSVTNIDSQLADLQPKQFEKPELVIKAVPEKVAMPKEPIKPTENNLPEKASECGKCELYKKAVSENKGNFEEKLADYERLTNAWLLDCQNIERLNAQNLQNWKDNKTQAEQAHELACSNYEVAQEYNSKIVQRRAELEALKAEISEANAKIESENKLIQASNELNIVKFGERKEKEITTIRSQLKAQDYTATNAIVLMEISEIENSKKVFSDEIAVLASRKSDLIASKNKLQELQGVMISTERKLIEAKADFKRFRDSFDSKCLLLFNGQVKVNTTRETYSDTIEDCFEVYFNRAGSWVEFQYLNHSDQILCGVALSKVLCEKFNCRLPLLIDNAEAINGERRPQNCVLAIVSETIEFQINNI